MTKNYLLTAAAVAALVAAGSAHAGSLSARAGTTPIVVTPIAPYNLASELNYVTGVSGAIGAFDTVFTFNNPLAAGSYTVTLAYSGATFAATSTTPVNSPALAQTGGTDTLTALGFEVSSANGANGPSSLTVVGQTSNSVTISMQIPAGNTVSAIFFAPALTVTGPVSVTAAVSNQISGQNVDPAVIQPLITTTNRSIALGIRGGLTAADGVAFADQAGTDTRIIEGAVPRFTTLNSAQVGQVVAAVAGTPEFNTITAATTPSSTVYRTLTGTAVTLADVTGLSVVTTGNLAGYRQQIGAGTQVTAAANAITNTADAATIAAAGGVLTFNLSNASGAATRPQLAPTNLSVAATATLSPTFAPLATVNGNFETIQTDGFTYIVPWVASQTLSGANGNQTVIRISNVNGDSSSAGGRVYAQMYNSTTGTTSVGGSVLLGTLGNSATAANELVVTSNTLEAAFGNFGRADFRLIVTDPAVTGNTVPGAETAAPTAPNNAGTNSIIVKRLIASAGGALTEVDVVAGATGSEANIPGNQAVPY